MCVPFRLRKARPGDVLAAQVRRCITNNISKLPKKLAVFFCHRFGKILVLVVRVSLKFVDESAILAGKFDHSRYSGKAPKSHQIDECSTAAIWVDRECVGGSLEPYLVVLVFGQRQQVPYCRRASSCKRMKTRTKLFLYYSIAIGRAPMFR